MDGSFTNYCAEGRWDTAKLLLEKARMSTLAVESGAVELIDEAKTLFLSENDLMGVAEAGVCRSKLFYA